MAQLVVVLNHRRGWSIEPKTIAAIALGVEDLCRFQRVYVGGQRVEVRARVRRVRQGSIKFHFDLQPIVDAATSDFGVGVASSIAASLVIATFRWLYEQTPQGRRAASKTLAKTLLSRETIEAVRSPELLGALRDLFSALQRDESITSLKVEAGDKDQTFDATAIEQADQVLVADDSAAPRDESVLWGKHVRIVDIIGQGPTEEWRLHWENPSGTVHESWVKAARVPSGNTWQAGIDKTLMVDMKVKVRHLNGRANVESAEIWSVHWAQML